METNYFGMDSFDRNTMYCCNNVSPQSAVRTKYVDLDGLKEYDRLSLESAVAADRVEIDGKSLTEIISNICGRIDNLECKRIVPVSSAFVLKRLKRADLNLIFK